MAAVYFQNINSANSKRVHAICCIRTLSTMASVLFFGRFSYAKRHRIVVQIFVYFVLIVAFFDTFVLKEASYVFFSRTSGTNRVGLSNFPFVCVLVFIPSSYRDSIFQCIWFFFFQQDVLDVSADARHRSQKI